MNRLAILVTLAVVVPSALAQRPANERLGEAVRLLRDGTEAEQNAAVKQLKDLSEHAAPAIPALVESIKDGPPARRAEIARILASFGLNAKEAIPTLVSVVCEPRSDQVLFQEAINTIAALGEPGNREVVRRCLSTENHGRGGRYVTTLHPNYLGQHLAATIPVIAELLVDSDAGTRQRAALSLALLLARPTSTQPSPLLKLPAATRERTIQALQMALDDLDARTRSWAAAALIDADPTTLPQALPILLSSIRSRNSQGNELGALVRSGAAGARLVADYLDEPNPDIRQALIGCLTSFGEDALPALADCLHHVNPRVREGVLRSLHNSGRMEKLRAHVTARLADPDGAVRLAAAVALVAKDPKRAGSTVPVLAALAFDVNSARRWEALVTLWTLGPMARPAIPDLLRRVGSGDGNTRLLAAEALAMADRFLWQSYVPVYITIVKTDDGGLRMRAINGLRDTGPNAQAALPVLRDCFGVKDPFVRVAAAEALFRIEPKAVDESVACLIAMLREPNVGGRQYCRQWRVISRALDKMGSAAKAAVPALIEAAQSDPDASFAPDMAAVAIRLDADRAGAAYGMFRSHLNPGHPDPDDLWLSKIVDLKKLALPLMPELIVALGAKNAVQLEAAFDTLAGLGPDARDAIPTLQAMVNAKKHEARANEVLQVIQKK